VAFACTDLAEHPELQTSSQQARFSYPPPVPTAEGTVVQFFTEQISAVQVDPWSILTFSFFPKLGTAFISQHAISLASKNTHQVASFAHCEFSWSRPQ